MDDEPSKKWYHKIIKESFSFAIALVVLIPFMIYFGVVLIYLQDTVLLEKMSALLGGLVAVVIGYYFGQKPTKQLTEQVKETQAESEDSKRETEEAISDFIELTKRFETFKRKFDEIKNP